MTTPRSVTHGTCALNGRHTSAEYARGCPVLLRAQNAVRNPPNVSTNTEIAERPTAVSETSDDPQGSRDSSAPLAAARKRLGRPGRPATGTSRWARRRRRLRG